MQAVGHNSYLTLSD